MNVSQESDASAELFSAKFIHRIRFFLVRYDIGKFFNAILSFLKQQKLFHHIYFRQSNSVLTQGHFYQHPLPLRYRAMSGAIFWFSKLGFHLTSSGQRLEMLIDILKCTEQPSHNNYLVQNVHSCGYQLYCFHLPISNFGF